MIRKSAHAQDPLPLVGVVPAAGFATRLAGVLEGGMLEGDASPVSKEALTVLGRPLIEHLLLRFEAAAIAQVAVVLRHGKDDLAEVLDQQKLASVEVVWTGTTASVPHTLVQAEEALLDRRVALGFPDILFEPLDAFAALDRRQRQSSADVVLGLFPTDRPGATDMVELDERGRPVGIVIKDPRCTLTYTWQMAVWTPRFTEYLVGAVAASKNEGELQVGDVLRGFLDQGESVEAVVFEQGSSLDVGTEGTLRQVDPSHFL